MSSLNQVAVIGAGSWGTALAWLLGSKGIPVKLWGRDAELVENLRNRRQNAKYLPNVELPATIEATGELHEALDSADVAVLAVPSKGMRATLRRAANLLGGPKLLLSAAKGLESDTGLRISEVVKQELGPEAANRYAVLSGPNLAREVAAGLPSSTVIASSEAHVAETLQELFRTSRFRVYTNPDVIGVEMGGALKNVIAIGAGMSDGRGFGDNTKAALLTRALHEITSLGVAEGARPETFAGLAGLGDLIVTCVSPKSRNYQLGLRLAQGETLASILASTSEVAEGYPTAAAVYKLANQHNLDMPISTCIYEILYTNKPIAAGVDELMTRASKPELGSSSPRAWADQSG